MDVNGKEWDLCRLDSSGLGWIPVADFCKSGEDIRVATFQAFVSV